MTLTFKIDKMAKKRQFATETGRFIALFCSAKMTVAHRAQHQKSKAPNYSLTHINFSTQTLKYFGWDFGLTIHDSLNLDATKCRLSEKKIKVNLEAFTH